VYLNRLRCRGRTTSHSLQVEGCRISCRLKPCTLRHLTLKRPSLATDNNHPASRHPLLRLPMIYIIALGLSSAQNLKVEKSLNPDALRLTLSFRTLFLLDQPVLTVFSRYYKTPTLCVRLVLLLGQRFCNFQDLPS